MMNGSEKPTEEIKHPTNYDETCVAIGIYAIFVVFC